ncbi:hypothetical protein PPL_07426 [Heterostelium album PN500]|uniref:Uncharacterized protein n=1 Tax=Heterostelium pallidum (strain ATCC 26659 / Pp 5 / PN500) TaxID=670386 RepID=D3BFX5_HETP5|nr:hypothetical protein PPL_07426 [Heterostelium album PN500]EFA79735.1 hypothetical protein PPL_07426 [Heterostelium album PN500]|eukprot:XP_020431856.1 hypothetical protein PPL_07426 [Heterostelium album PN500]
MDNDNFNIVNSLSKDGFDRNNNDIINMESVTFCGYCNGEQCKGEINCQQYLLDQCIPIYDQCSGDVLFSGVVQFTDSDLQVYDYDSDTECLSQNYSVSTMECNSCITSINGYFECPTPSDDSSSGDDSSDSDNNSNSNSNNDSNSTSSTTTSILTISTTSSSTSPAMISTISSSSSSSSSSTATITTGSISDNSNSNSNNCSIGSEDNIIFLSLLIISPFICIVSLIIHVVLVCYKRNREYRYLVIKDDFNSSINRRTTSVSSDLSFSSTTSSSSPITTPITTPLITASSTSTSSSSTSSSNCSTSSELPYSFIPN